MFIYMEESQHRRTGAHIRIMRKVRRPLREGRRGPDGQQTSPALMQARTAARVLR